MKVFEIKLLTLYVTGIRVSKNAYIVNGTIPFWETSGQRKTVTVTITQILDNENYHFPENALLIRSTLTLACVRILVRLFMLGVQTSAQNTYTCVCPPPPHS